MSLSILGAILLFFIVVLVLSIYLKRNFGINYDSKTLISGLLLVFMAIVIWINGSISADPRLATDLNDKIQWLVLITVGANALLQFFTWIFYTLIRHNDLTKMPRFMFNIIALLLIVAITLAAAKFLFGLNLSGLLVTSTVLSAIIGLSLQDTLVNLFAGVSLQTESPFNIDDWVNLGGHEGKVVSQTWRSLTLLSRENHRITLPNKLVAEEKIINYSRPSPRQIHSFNIQLDYSHPPNEVKKILDDVLIDIRGVDIDEIAFPYVVNYADSGVTYCLKFWIDDYGIAPYIQDTVLSRLWYALERNGIKIPYPINEVHMQLKNESAKQEKLNQVKDLVQLRLKQQDWLSELADEQLQLLAENAQLKRYAREENLVVEGDSGDSMFIILSGSARVLLKGKQQEVKVAEKLPGSFFGEMSLLTGDPRTATVRASEDLEVIVIDKDSFSEILLKDSKILELLVSGLETNQSSLSKIIEEERKNAKGSTTSARLVLMNKIKQYLSIS